MTSPHIPDHYWKNLLAITTKAQAEAGGDTPAEPAKTRQWLEHALSDFVSKSDPSKQLAQVLQKLHGFAASTSTLKENDVDEVLTLADHLEDLLAVADFTSQFFNSGGLLILESLIKQKTVNEVRAPFASVILTLAENNEPAQNVLVENGFLDFLLDILVDDSESVGLRLAVLSAISGIVRSNLKAFGKFESLDGPQKLLNLTSKDNNEKVAAKASRILTSVSYTMQDYQNKAKVLFPTIAQAYINLIEFGVEFAELEYVREFISQYIERSDLPENTRKSLLEAFEAESKRVLDVPNTEMISSLRSKFTLAK